ncbi:hypothetical protein BU15DRAFT_76445 [Melanogaster broomeanus]|nr:hypothetical protein BU15DRAFT_76445 [Melanogaster broomeanus]
MDRWCMLSEAIAATRAGYFLMGDGFFIMAIYLRSNLTAERYLLMQTDSDGKVCIAQKDFKLTNSDEAINFLREMYNLTAKVEALVAGLDPSKQNPQKDKKDKSKTTGRSTITSEEDYFTDLEIQRHLEEMGYEIDGVLFGHEHVAKISSPSDCGFLKFTRREKEVQILEHLAGIVDPANHTITGTHVWKMQSGGYIIYMSSGGGHLTSLIQPDAHLWSVAEQLVEAVGFMHRHGVVHLDIKPQNVLIPVHGGHLSIIDFSIAAFVKSPQIRFKGPLASPRRSLFLLMCLTLHVGSSTRVDTSDSKSRPFPSLLEHLCSLWISSDMPVSLPRSLGMSVCIGALRSLGPVILLSCKHFGQLRAGGGGSGGALAIVTNCATFLAHASSPSIGVAQHIHSTSRLAFGSSLCSSLVSWSSLASPSAWLLDLGPPCSPLSSMLGGAGMLSVVPVISAAGLGAPAWVFNNPSWDSSATGPLL